MVLEEGGPCISVYKHKGQRNAELCGLEISHRWYAGPTCKKCYERAGRTGVKQQRRGASEEEEASGGDFLLTVLKVSGVRCAAHPTSAPLPPPLAAHSDSHVVFLCRTSAIPRAFFDRSNPPPETDDDEEELQYDIYGWYKFEDKDAEGVRRLDRQWVAMEGAAAAEGWDEGFEAFNKKCKDKLEEMT